MLVLCSRLCPPARQSSGSHVISGGKHEPLRNVVSPAPNLAPTPTPYLHLCYRRLLQGQSKPAIMQLCGLLFWCLWVLLSNGECCLCLDTFFVLQVEYHSQVNELFPSTIFTFPLCYFCNVHICVFFSQFEMLLRNLSLEVTHAHTSKHTCVCVCVCVCVCIIKNWCVSMNMHL